MKRNWKPLLALLLCLILSIGLVGCDGSSGQDGSDSSTDTDTGTVEPEVEHLLAMTDIRNGKVIVVDMDADDPLSEDAVVWEWSAKRNLGWKYIDRCQMGLDDAKLRWSEYYQKYVVIMVSSSNWAGIADFETGECLWETPADFCPHSIEMLPNGDIVVAGSGGNNYSTEGCLMYYNITAGDDCRMTDKEALSSAHGVVWDPQEEVLWALGYSQIAAYAVFPDGKNGPDLSRIQGMGCNLPSVSGHDLGADYTDPDLLWITSGSQILKFSKSQNRILTDYTYSGSLLSQKNVKGVTNFEDGVVAYCAGTGVLNEWSTDTFWVLWPRGEDGRRSNRVKYVFQDRVLYKVRNFSAYYQ